MIRTFLSRQGLSTLRTRGALEVQESERESFQHGHRVTERALFDLAGTQVTRWATDGESELSPAGDAALRRAEQDECDREVACGA